MQGTMSNKRATKHLRDASFGFSKVIECENFFLYVLGNKNSFEAIIDNPPWDLWLLRVYFRFVRFLLVLPGRATEFECFVKIFQCGPKMEIYNL